LFVAFVVKNANETVLIPITATTSPPADFARKSDERMCKNIGVDAFLGAAAMTALWRRTFTAERDNRAGPDANAQRRGQISRQLKADLQEVINDGND
jgi:hypothetical protein